MTNEYEWVWRADTKVEKKIPFQLFSLLSLLFNIKHIFFKSFIFLDEVYCFKCFTIHIFFQLLCSNQSPTSHVIEVQSQAENDWLMALSKYSTKKESFFGWNYLLSDVIILVVTNVKVIVVIFFITAATHCEAPNEYWLNGYDNDDSGSFTWIDSRNLTTYTNWQTAQPSSSAEKCVAAFTGNSGGWNDIPCTLQRPVVCERNT